MRWRAVSDGGEDQGAEEAFMGGMKKAKIHHVSFGKLPSRATGSSFQRANDKRETDTVLVYLPRTTR